MRKDRSQKTIYNACDSEGSFFPLEKADFGQIKTMVDIALDDFASAKEWARAAEKEGKQWNAIYKLHYDVLHVLAEAFLQFDKIKAATHECIFAYLCEKHPELELDWNFFEKVRTKRNRSIYYGEPAAYKDWKEVELQINLYINLLSKAIKEKLFQP